MSSVSARPVVRQGGRSRSCLRSSPSLAIVARHHLLHRARRKPALHHRPSRTPATGPTRAVRMTASFVVGVICLSRAFFVNRSSKAPAEAAGPRPWTHPPATEARRWYPGLRPGSATESRPPAQACCPAGTAGCRSVDALIRPATDDRSMSATDRLVLWLHVAFVDLHDRAGHHRDPVHAPLHPDPQLVVLSYLLRTTRIFGSLAGRAGLRIVAAQQRKELQHRGSPWR